MQAQATAVRQGGSWRISLDRAWRSEAVRRKFEDECGFAPLVEIEKGRREQILSGEVEAYHEQFLLWATKYLGLTDQAPLDVRRKLSSERQG